MECPVNCNFICHTAAAAAARLIVKHICMHLHIAINNSLYFNIILLSHLFIVSLLRRQHFNSIFKRAESVLFCFFFVSLFFFALWNSDQQFYNILFFFCDQLAVSVNVDSLSAPLKSYWAELGLGRHLSQFAGIWRWQSWKRREHKSLPFGSA